MAEFTFHHGGVSVPDLDEAIAWYGRVLGFEEEARFDIEKADARVAFVRKGPLRFEFFEVAGAAPLPAWRRQPNTDIATHGNKHLALRIEDLDRFLEEMEQKHVVVASVVREAICIGCFIRDCAGNLIEFLETAE